uniref:hypothetical protein n=1 Tax=Pseudomonas sp. TH41 TaxID=2796405 RepID=UPI001F5C055E|nr:hypothetical protein [Pseudomonas sp. TH41]
MIACKAWVKPQVEDGGGDIDQYYKQCAARGALQMIAENRFSDVVAAQTLRFFKDHLVAQQTMSAGMATSCYRG